MAAIIEGRRSDHSDTPNSEADMSISQIKSGGLVFHRSGWKP